jgi:hypothetical protein
MGTVDTTLQPVRQGSPGEVTTAQMETAIPTAIGGTAQNPTSITPLSLSISDPPTQAEVQSIVDAYNTLISALQR